MRIQKIEIYSYGKWTNKTIDFTSHFTVLQGENEAGKSTIMEFIKGVLFGFGKRENGKYSFESKEKSTSTIGGRLYIKDDKYGDYIIERIALQNGGTSLQVTNAMGEPFPHSLEELYSHITKEQYDLIYYFDDTQLEKFHMVSKEDISYTLYSIGKTGSQQIVEVMKRLKKEAALLFTGKSKKRPLNQALNELKKLEYHMLQEKKSSEQYMQLVEQYDAVSHQITTLKQTLDEDLDKEKKLLAYVSVYDVYKEWKTLKSRLSTVDIKEDSVIRDVKSLLHDVELVEEKINHLNEIEPHNESVHQIEWFEQHKETLTAIVQEASQMEARFWNLEKVEEESVQLKKEIAHQKDVLHVIHSTPKVICEKDREMLTELLDQDKKWTAQLEYIEAEVKTFDTSTSLKTNKKVFSHVCVALAFISSIIVFFQPLVWGITIFLIVIWLGYFKFPLQSGKIKEKKQLLDSIQKQKQNIQMQLDKWLQQSDYASYSYSVDELLQRDVFRELREKESMYYRLLKQIESLKKQLELDYQKCTFYIEAFPSDEIDFISILESMKTFYMYHTMQPSHLPYGETKNKLLEEKKEVLARIQFILDSLQIETIEELKSWCDRQVDVLVQKQRMEDMEKIVRSYHQQLETYPTKFAIEQNLKTTQEEIEKKQTAYQQLFSTQSQLMYQIQEIEHQQSHSMASELYEAKKRETRELIVEWGGKTIAAAALLRALSGEKGDSIQLIEEEVLRIFKRLTDQNYIKVSLKQDDLYVVHRNGMLFLFHQLSKGTLDQLYISIRLAFIKHTGMFAPFPILIDDGFVHFDEQRKKEILLLLEELSQHTQIIYSTTHLNCSVGSLEVL